MNKNIELDFISYLKNPEIKIISFDIFDTLLYRKTFEPNNVFQEIQNKFNLDENFYFNRIYKEDFTRKNSLKEDIAIEEIYNNFTHSINNNLIKNELLIEENLLYVNLKIEEYIKMAYENHKQIILISDIYYSKNIIYNLLSKKMKYFNLIKEIYTSSDVGALKSTGNLYKYVLEKEHIKGHELLHIGDNYLSDIVMPRLQKIKTLYVGKSDNLDNCFQIEKEIISTDVKWQALRGHSSFFGKEKCNIENSSLFEIGSYVFGPILFNFCKWLLDLTKDCQINQINLFMREGGLFFKLLKKIKCIYPEYSNIELNLIYASRASLYFPFYKTENIDSSNLIYGNMTVSDYYKLHRITTTNEFIKDNFSIQFIKTKDIFNLQNKHLYSLIQEDFYLQKERIRNESIKQVNLFKNYLKQIKYSKNSILVDFGGGGTILEIFNEIVGKESPTKNILFFRKELSFYKKIDIETFLPFSKKTKKLNNFVLKYAPIIEALINGNFKTTISYYEHNNQIFPLLGHSVNIPKEFELGVLNYIETLDYFKIENQKIDFYDRLSSLEILYRFLNFPTQKEAKAMSSIQIENSINGDKYTTIINHKSLEILKNIGIEKYYINSLQNNDPNTLLKTFWPQGNIALYNNIFMQQLNGIYLDPITKYSKAIVSLLQQNNIENISIYGGGNLFVHIYKEIIFRNLNITIDYIIMSKKNSLKYYQWDIITPDEILIKQVKNIVIASLTYKKEMLATLSNLKINGLNIINSQEGELSIES